MGFSPDQAGGSSHPAHRAAVITKRTAATGAPLTSLMSEMGLGRVKTCWRKHRRVAILGGDHAQSFCRVWRLFRSGNGLEGDSSRLGRSATADGRLSATMPSLPP